MREAILSIGLALAVAIPALFGLIPAWISLFGILALLIIKDVIMAFITRGLPMECVNARLFGGIMWARSMEAGYWEIKRRFPKAGMIHTDTTAYNVAPGRIRNVDGIPFAIVPEHTGYNVGVDHALLIDELKKRGVTSILDVCNVDEFGYFESFKDDPRIKDLFKTYLDVKDGKEKAGGVFFIKPWPINLDDFYKYTKEASSPVGQKANIRIGIAQGLFDRLGGNKGLWILGGLCCVLIALVAILIFRSGGNQLPENMRWVIENTGRTVIPG